MVSEVNSPPAVVSRDRLRQMCSLAKSSEGREHSPSRLLDYFAAFGPRLEGTVSKEALLEALDPRVAPLSRHDLVANLTLMETGQWKATKTPNYEISDALRTPWSVFEHNRVGSVGPELAVSVEFLSKLLKFVAWAPGWDGERAEHVEQVTAVRAIETALSMRAVVPEPFVAPAPSGALLLQWDFADGASVEIFVDSETEFPEEAAVTDEGAVYEVSLSGSAALRSLLAERTTIAAT